MVWGPVLLVMEKLKFEPEGEFMVRVNCIACVKGPDELLMVTV